jgi:hypothetical protein
MDQNVVQKCGSTITALQCSAHCHGSLVHTVDYQYAKSTINGTQRLARDLSHSCFIRTEALSLAIECRFWWKRSL